MIPSPTKLALLTGVVLLAGGTLGHPVHYDQRQDGDLNVRADVEDVLLIAAPPKDYITDGISWLGGNFVRQVAPNKIPFRTASKHGFVPAEKSPYKVDLGKSSVPLAKLQDVTPFATSESKTVKKALKDEDGNSEEKTEPHKQKTDGDKSKTGEKQRAEGEKHKHKTEGGKQKTEGERQRAEGEKQKSGEKQKNEGGKQKADVERERNEGERQKADNDKGSGLVVVMNSSDPDSIMRWEDCGPDAHRDSTGKCVYQ